MPKRKHFTLESDKLESDIIKNIQNIKSCVQQKRVIYDIYLEKSKIYNENIVKYKKNTNKLYEEYRICQNLLLVTASEISLLNKSQFNSVDTIALLSKKIDKLKK